MSDINAKLLKKIEDAVSSKEKMQELVANPDSFAANLPAIQLTDDEMAVVNGGNAFTDWLGKGDWYFNGRG